MHNTLAVLVQENMAPNYSGGKTNKSSDNSQLVFSLCRLQDPGGVITVPSRKYDSNAQNLLSAQMKRGFVLASRSFCDKRSLDEIAEELCDKYDGSGGCTSSSEDYKSIEFATASKNELIDSYFA